MCFKQIRNSIIWFLALLVLLQVSTLWIKAPLSKTAPFSAAEPLQSFWGYSMANSSSALYRQVSGCGQLNLIDDTEAFSILLPVKLILLCHFHIKCFYSSEEGDICMAWYEWVQELFSRCSTSLSLFWSSHLCLRFAVMLNKAEFNCFISACTRCNSQNELYWSEHCALVSSCCRRRQPMIGYKSFVCRVFCLNKPLSSAQDLFDTSYVYKRTPAFGSVI